MMVTENAPKNQPLFIRVPKSVKKKFRTYCSEIGLSMNEVINDLIRKKMKEDKDWLNW